MMFQFLAIFGMLIYCSSGFLLQSNSSASTGTVVSRSEFYKTKQSLQYEDNALRQKLIQVQTDNDRNLQFLAKQMEQELNIVKRKLENIDHQNGSQTEASIWETKYRELENNHTQLRTDFEDINAKYQVLKGEMDRMSGDTVRLKIELMNISKLEAVQDRRTLDTMTQDINKLETKVSRLTANEQARSQDFLALYNQTKVHNKLSSDVFDSFNTSLTELQNQLKASSSAVGDKIRQLETSYSKLPEQVSVTACKTSSTTYSTNQKIIFDDIKVKVGAVDIAAMKNGDFKCLSQGLYQISVVILSSTSSADFKITKNNQMISHDYISNDDHFDNGVNIVAVELKINDIVSAITEQVVTVNFYGSCITIVKI